MRTGTITLSIASRADDVFLIGLAVNRIMCSIPVSEQSAFEIELAVIEAVNNSIEHAHHFRPEKSVTVTVELRSDSVRLVIADQGEPFDFDAAVAAGATIDPANQPERGRGLKIIHDLIDEIRFKRQDNTNQLTLIKYLKGSWRAE